MYPRVFTHDAFYRVQSGKGRRRSGPQRIHQGIDVEVLDGDSRGCYLFHESPSKLYFGIGRICHGVFGLAKSDNLRTILGNQGQYALQPGRF
jgi:hypothetical protein